jgi:hypothetical protein
MHNLYLHQERIPFSRHYENGIAIIGFPYIGNFANSSNCYYSCYCKRPDSNKCSGATSSATGEQASANSNYPNSKRNNVSKHRRQL